MIAKGEVSGRTPTGFNQVDLYDDNGKFLGTWNCKKYCPNPNQRYRFEMQDQFCYPIK